LLRRFIRDGAVYAASAALSRGIAILLLPLYTRFLGPAEFGMLDLLMIVATISGYLVTVEISQGLARSYAAAKTPDEKNAYVSSAARFVLFAYASFAVFGLVLAPTLAELLLESSAAKPAVLAMVFAIVANGVFFLFQDLLRWQLQPLKYAASSLTYSIVSASAGAVMVVFLHLGVVGILLGQVVGAFVGIAVAWSNGACAGWQAPFDRIRLGEMLSYSAPQVLSSLAAYSTLCADRFFIRDMLGLESVGIYGVGARVASIVALLMAGFQAGYIPTVFTSYADKETPSQMAKVFRHFIAGAIFIMLFLCAFSKELLKIFATKDFYGAWYVVPVLAGAIMLANMYIFAPGVFIERRTGIVALINVTAALLNVGLLIVLIPILGILGAAFAMVVSSFMAFLLYLWTNAHFYPLPFDWGKIITATFTGVLFSLILMLFQSLDDRVSLLVKIATLVTGVALSGFILLAKDYESFRAAFRPSGIL